ncbi:MAG: ABC transporter ATP-binding protein [Proteobacteria bacterium]|nr:MAG: ABC transporter ATP-binding protein [Pseudomonadota bacterium]
MSASYIIETESLTKEFKEFVAVSNLSLRIQTGSIHALIGPNGAGKTTVFNLISKFLEPTRGRIRYKGQDITGVRPARLARMGMVRSFQISAVFPHLTVLQNVRIALQRQTGLSYRFWCSKRVLDRLNDRAIELLDDVGLADYRNDIATVLPYGRKRALEIATTLALDPELMLLDEPMAGMVRSDISRVSELIRHAARNRTVVMVEHNLDVVSELSDSITVLQRGSILAEGSYHEVSRNPDVRRAYLGTGDD